KVNSSFTRARVHFSLRWSPGSNAAICWLVKATALGGAKLKIKVLPSSVFRVAVRAAYCHIVVVLPFKNTLSNSSSQTYNAVLLRTTEALLAASGHLPAYK